MSIQEGPMTCSKDKRMKDEFNKFVKDIWAKETNSSFKGNNVYLNMGQDFINYLSVLNRPKLSHCEELTQ